MNENPETSNRVPVADLAVDACSAWGEMPRAAGWWWRKCGPYNPVAEFICEIHGKFYFASPYYNQIRTSFDEWIKPDPAVKFNGPILPPNAQDDSQSPAKNL